MTIGLKTWGLLVEQFPTTSLFGAWLRGLPIPGSKGAAAEWESARSNPMPHKKAPLWQVPEFAALLPAEFRSLREGPSVVVTGQQPGFLGGPLLILYKIATAVAVAQQRTAAGLPTVPVFWSGDDDDDLAEGLSPVGWSASARKVWSSPARALLKNPATQRGILADRGSDEWAAPLTEMFQDANDALSADLQQLLAEATASGLNWGEGQQELVQRIFAGTGLVIIRGNDSRLHETAAPLYGHMSERLDELAALVRRRGLELEAAGFQAQINDRSLQRSMFRAKDGHREFAASFEGTDTGDLRPGVMLRSPVQDWLLQPAAVVVGPGELAYLRQLDPLYGALDLPRSPLVPRLSGWVLPAGDLDSGLTELLAASEPPVAEDLALQWADEIADVASAKITAILQQELQLEPGRASAMADSRARRFHKGVAAMFRDEQQRQENERLAAAPQWVLPAGKRQERSLGVLSAIDLWGSEFVAVALAAAQQHLEFGNSGAWQEMAITVPEGTVLK